MNQIFYSPMFFPRIPLINDRPPMLYDLMESIVNYGKDEKTKIKDLAKKARLTIFDFDYTLSPKVDKEKFECMILNHFINRRIGFETFTSFQIQLNVKLNEILPLYNKMFDALDGWNIFEDGETTIKNSTDNRIIDNKSNSNSNVENTSETISDRRYSDTPQNELVNLQDGNYVTDANYDVNKDKSNSIGKSNSNNNTIDNNISQETIKRSPADKILIYKEFQENLKNIYTMIFKDLDCLFYQLV